MPNSFSHGLNLAIGITGGGVSFVDIVTEAAIELLFPLTYLDVVPSLMLFTTSLRKLLENAVPLTQLRDNILSGRTLSTGVRRVVT